MKSLTNVSNSLVTSLYEGILGDIENRIDNMDADLEATYDFPDKKDIQYWKTGIRYYDWTYYKALDNNAVRELFKQDHITFREEGHAFAPRIRVEILTTRPEKIYKHKI